MNFDIKSAIASIAPTLATMLGGPLAGTAVTALEGVFGLTPAATPQDGINNITQAMQTSGMTPDIVAAMRSADQKHAETISQQGIDLAKVNNDYKLAITTATNKDRDSARQRQIALKDQTPARLAYMIIGGFFIVSIAQLVALMGFTDIASKIPSQGWLLIGSISGYLASEAKAAASYFFGTTKGSSDKNDLLANKQSALPPTGQPT